MGGARERWRGAVRTVSLQNRVVSLVREAHSGVSSLWESTAYLPPIGDDYEKPLPIISAFYDLEYSGLRFVQRFVPMLTPLALAVHYAVLEEVATPVLALLVWLVSLRAATSVILFVNMSHVLNAVVKWAVQRPRPAWKGYPGGDIINVRGAWEKDLSFPSGHTTFFSGLAVCACLSFGFGHAWLPVALGVGILSGLTRNYLGVHFISDTLVGWGVGATLGWLWAEHDPYSALLQRADPLTSLAVASGTALCCIAALLLVRTLVPGVPDTQVRTWFLNATSTLAPELRAALRAPDVAEPLKSKYSFKPRALEALAPMITVIWTALALTALYPTMLPSAAEEPRGSAGWVPRLVCAAVGLLGLVVWAASMLVLKKKAKVLSGVPLKVLTFLGASGWAFLGAQLASRRLLAAWR